MPYFHVYGRNRYSKRLVLIEGNLRTKAEARELLADRRESIGHDYTLRITETVGRIPT